jgi:hypothetical protein
MATIGILAFPPGAVAEIGLRLKNDKKQDLKIEWREELKCPGKTKFEEPPIGKGDEFLTLRIKDKDNLGNRDITLYNVDDPKGAEECGHMHKSGAANPGGPNTACHKYVWNGTQWVLVHICP